MSRTPLLAWSWRNAAYGAVLAMPATIATAIEPSVGIPLAVGVLPAAALALRPTRTARGAVVLTGVIAGASLFVGAVMSAWPPAAVVALFVLCVVVAWFAADPRTPHAPVVMALGLPLYGSGLSAGDARAGAIGAALLIGGSFYAWGVSHLWRTTTPPAPARRQGADTPPAGPTGLDRVVYGVQLGTAGAIGAASGYALGADHPGWPATSALLVSRPDRRTLDRRGWQRGVAVVVGAIIACSAAALHPSALVLGAMMLLVLVTVAATAGSTFYVMPMLSTIIVLTLLTHEETRPAAHWFAERVGLSVLGVVAALLAGWIIPRATRVARR